MTLPEGCLPRSDWHRSPVSVGGLMFGEVLRQLGPAAGRGGNDSRWFGIYPQTVAVKVGLANHYWTACPVPWLGVGLPPWTAVPFGMD